MSIKSSNMCASSPDLIAHVSEVAASACWQQWRALSRPSKSKSIIDPEALVLFSLRVRAHERRLQDLLSWWASRGSAFLSVQRMKTLRACYPPSVESDLAWFARECVAAGDKRWKRLAESVEPASIKARKEKGAEEPLLNAPPALMLQLRAGFGIGVKADILVFLCGSRLADDARGGWLHAEGIAEAISYSSATVHSAVRDMRLAGILETSAGSPTRYRVDSDAWREVLNRLWHPDLSPSVKRRPMPRWHFWSQVFHFLSDALEWLETRRELPQVVSASKARDVAEQHQKSLHWIGLQTAGAYRHVGAEYNQAFETLIKRVTAWATECA